MGMTPPVFLMKDNRARLALQAELFFDLIDS
jgi:hypothetical protein